MMNIKNKIWQDVANDLANRIYAKEFAYGSRFFSLTALSKEYGISDITSRKVIARLTEMGLINSIPGSGAYIKSRLREKNIILLSSTTPNLVEADQLPSIPAEKYKGMLMECGRQNAGLQLLSGRFVKQLPLDRELMLISMGMDFSEDLQLAKIVARENCHAVVCGEDQQSPLPKIKTDYHKGIQLAVKHLIKKGHRRIAYLTSSPEINYSMRLRYESFIETLKDFGIPNAEELIVKLGTPDQTNDSKAIARLLKLPKPPTAVLTANNTRAVNVIEYCNKNGVKIPETLAVVGFDYIPEAVNINPKPTVVNTLWEQIGAEAVKKVLMMAESGNKNSEDTIIEPQLVVRHTT